jgi:GxxExxY protein
METERRREAREEDVDRLTRRIIGFAIDVHRGLGPGLLESAYEACLCHDLAQAGIPFSQQVNLPVRYRGVDLECGYRMDLVVADQVIIEIKSVERLLPIHEAQLLTYLWLSGMAVGLLMNFNMPVLKHGLRRLNRSP